MTMESRQRERDVWYHLTQYKALREAIENVKDCVRYAISEHNWSDGQDAYDEESLTIAVEAMKKQDPMKPEKINDNYYCRVCNEFVGSEDCYDGEGKNIRYEKTYCENCGQAIDWNEGDE